MNINLLNKLSSHKYSAQIMLTGITLTFMMFVWAFNSSHQMLRQQAPLIDSIMQLRVDLAQIHLLTDENINSTHRKADKKNIMVSLNSLKIQANQLYQGRVEIGQVHNSISNSPYAKKQLYELKSSIQTLTSYLDKHYIHLQQNASYNLRLDNYFANSAILAEQFDQTVHRNIAQALHQQNVIFSIQFIFGIFFIAVLFFILKRNDRIEKLAAERSIWLSQALEHSGEAVIISSHTGVIEFVNDAFCQMTGYSAQETLGNNPSMLSSGQQNKPFYEKLWSTIQNGQVWQGELTNKRKDGTLYPALMTIAPIFNQHGKLSHFVANQRDISEHKALEENLFQAHKLEAIGTLTSGIAHDFNNALTGITGNIYLLKKHPDDQAKTLKRCASIKQICDAAATHIKQLLSYARNDFVLMSSIDLNQSILHACQMANLMIPATVDMKFITHTDHLYVYWNETQIQQILINLINNARHALQSTEHPAIIIEVEPVKNNKSIMQYNHDMTDENYICISVKDNGSGMTKDVVERIFEPFFTTKQGDEGTGLGLSMAYGAIKQAGGDLQVESQPNVGTAFNIYLPVGTVEHIEDNPDANQTYQGHGQTILIADDEKSLLQTLESILKSFGYHVLKAHDGRSAVDVFKQHAGEISLVILDLVMPNLGGVQAAQQILSINSDVSIIFSTGYDQDKTHDTANNKINAPLIYKPYKPEAMSKLIAEQLKAQPQSRVYQFKD